MIAPGRACGAYADGSCAGNRSLHGTGRKELYSASARFPNSVQMGSCTVTRNTLHKLISALSSKNNLTIPIGERPFNLDLVNQCFDTGIHVPSSQESLSMLHELRDGVSPISDTLLEYGSDKSDCLRLVENETPSESFLGERAGLKYGQHPRIYHDWMENGPGGGGACPVLLVRFSWFGTKPVTRLLSPSPLS